MSASSAAKTDDTLMKLGLKKIVQNRKTEAQFLPFTRPLNFALWQVG